jgi:hypothetical protein
VRGAVSTEVPEKCIKPPAPIADRSAKFPSSLQKGAQFTVRIATESVDPLEEIDTKQEGSHTVGLIILFFHYDLLSLQLLCIHP